MLRRSIIQHLRPHDETTRHPGFPGDTWNFFDHTATNSVVHPMGAGIKGEIQR
ncbi:MAG: hypothetical protein U5R46_03775 [Gammaproteobacteria bacterium]|nr:hypothetical protein [Gammaproteobacteria bacterium]